MALGGKHSLPGFEKSLEDLRADILLMAALVRRSVSNAKTGLTQRDEEYSWRSLPMMKRWICWRSRWIGVEPTF